MPVLLDAIATAINMHREISRVPLISPDLYEGQMKV